MPRVAVAHCRRDFEDSVDQSVSFLRQAEHFRVSLRAGSSRHIGPRRVELLAALALLRIHLSWEQFVESLFLRYLCGGVSTAGYAPVVLCPIQHTISAAMTFLLPSGQRYLSWGVDPTLARAGRHFASGEPFATGLGAISQTLGDISTVRNRFVHRSDYAVQEFRAVLIREFGYLPRGMTPGRFLLTTNASGAGHAARYIDDYANMLLGAGAVLAP